EPWLPAVAPDQPAAGQPSPVCLREAHQHRRQPGTRSRADDRARPRPEIQVPLLLPGPQHHQRLEHAARDLPARYFRHRADRRLLRSAGGLDVSPEAKIIQLWHAGSGFKSIGYSRFGSCGSAGRVGAHRKYTYAITGSKNLIPVYAEAFGIEESAVVATGLPRIDTFLNKERTQKLVADFFEKYPNLIGKRIILFAPTFRGRGIDDAYYDYSRIDFARLYEMCGETSVVLFRMHHFVTVPVPIPPEHPDRLINDDSFPETNDLLHVADVLITDYSSVVYEFSLLNRPMLFYAYDKDTYSAVHGFHRDYDATAPGKVCMTFDELVKALQNEDYDMSKVEAFRRKNFDSLDTGSADRVIDWLILNDPPGGGQPTSEPACRDPATAAVAARPSAANRGRKP